MQNGPESKRAERAAGRHWRTLLCAAAAAGVVGCAAFHPPSPYYDQVKPWHTESGFRDDYEDVPERTALRFVTWRLFGEHAQPPPDGWHIPIVAADVPWLRANRSEDAITWIGHSTFLLQLGGLNFLSDPQLSERASPVSWAGPRRYEPPALDFDTLPHIDVVLISHSHYDHLDLPTVTRLAAQPGGPPRFIVPLGLLGWFRAQGIENVTELDWWESTQIDGARISAVPAQHWSARSRLDRNETLWCGFVVESSAQRIFFAGDTGYSPDFRKIAQRYGPFDLAAIPIGAYDPRSMMHTQHVDPEEAVQIHLDLHARHSVGMHWGTFQLTDEPLDEPPVRLAKATRRAGLPAGEFFVMAVGETRLLSNVEQARAPGLPSTEPAVLLAAGLSPL